MIPLSPPNTIIQIDSPIWKDWFRELYRYSVHIGDVTKIRTNSSSPYSVLDDDHLVLMDTTSSNITTNLPPGKDQQIFIFKVIAGSNNIVLTPNGSETIDGAASLNVSDKATIVFSSENSGWYSI